MSDESEEDKAMRVVEMMTLAAYIQRLDYTNGNFTQTAEKIEQLSSELMAVHTRLLAEEDAPTAGYKLPDPGTITIGNLPEVKKELCQLVGEFDKAITAAKGK